MPYTDDYTIVGAAADNFDCDSATGWTAGGNAAATSTDTANKQEGTASLKLVTTEGSTGSCTWYHDVSSGSRFKITDDDLGFWFYYIKGKGDQYLTSAASALVIRLYFGGTTLWADYQPTAAGNDSLNFGWNYIQISGTNRRGGGESTTAPTYTDDVHRVQLRLDFANTNDTTSADPVPLLMDAWHVGTTITLSAAGTSSLPVGFTDIADYCNRTRTGYPVGVVTVSGQFVSVKCGITIGDGTSPNFSWLKAVENFVLWSQESSEVKHHIKVTNYSGFEIGSLDTSGTFDYPYGGCQFVLPASRYSDINIENGATFKCYGSKIYRWRYIYLGAASDTGTTVDVQETDFDSCETIYFRATTLTLKNNEIHANAGQVNSHCAEMVVAPDTNVALKVYDNTEGIHFRDTMEVDEYLASDNTNYDLAVLEGKTVTLLNSLFLSTKLKRVAS